jgi:hypothetical protein
VELFNAQGQRVQALDDDGGQHGAGTVVLPVPPAAGNVFLLRITAKDQVYTRKVVRQ